MINNTTTFHQHSKAQKSRTLHSMYQKPVTQVSTALVLTIFAIVFFAAFAIRPTLATIAELIKKIDAQRVVVEQLNKKSAALATAQSEYLLVEKKIPLVTAAIPTAHTAGTLLKQIEGTAASIGIPIASIQVDSIDIPTEIGKSRVVDGVVELPLTVSIQAPYEKLREFVVLIDQLKRFVTVESIAFVLDESEGGTAEIKMNLQLLAYYLPLTTDKSTVTELEQ